jgi:peptide/nickel transport system permease protein
MMHRGRHAQPADPVRHPHRQPVLRNERSPHRVDLRPVELDGYQPARSEPVLSIRGLEFVEAARAVGVRDRRIIFRHILPNAFGPIVVAASLIVAAVIIGEAFVSFLGFGVNPTTPTWGNILSNALTFIPLGNWWWPFFPGFAIVLVVLAVNFIGDGMRDAFDPRSRL